MQGALADIEAAQVEEAEQLGAELEAAGYPERTRRAQLRRLEERHKRAHRRARIDALLEGITALETVYRDALAGSADERLNVDRDVMALDPRAAAAALDACRDARQAIAEFNPNETLLVERLFLHLPPAGGVTGTSSGALTGNRYTRPRAGVAQTAEQLTRNEQAKGSSPFSGSIHCAIRAGARRSRPRALDGTSRPTSGARPTVVGRMPARGDRRRPHLVRGARRRRRPAARRPPRWHRHVRGHLRRRPPVADAGPPGHRVELQGHGHTPDTGRAMSLERFADDVAGWSTAWRAGGPSTCGGSASVRSRPRAWPSGIRRRSGAWCSPARTSVPTGYHAEITAPEQDDPRLPTEAEFARWQADYEAVAPNPATSSRSWSGCSPSCTTSPAGLPTRSAASTRPRSS